MSWMKLMMRQHMYPYWVHNIDNSCYYQNLYWGGEGLEHE